MSKAEEQVAETTGAETGENSASVSISIVIPEDQDYQDEDADITHYNASEFYRTNSPKLYYWDYYSLFNIILHLIF